MAHSTGRQSTGGARAAERFAAESRDASNAGGWRARIGVVVPSVNTVVEPWFSAMSPPGVSVHASRMFLDNALTPESIIRMDQDEGMRAEHAFFAAAGLEVLSSACLGIKDAFKLAAPTLRDIHELALRAWKPGAEALLITCLNLWSQGVVERLETEFGVPVVTSTQATFWRLLRIAGIDDRIPQYGRLLAEH